MSGIPFVSEEYDGIPKRLTDYVTLPTSDGRGFVTYMGEPQNAGLPTNPQDNVNHPRHYNVGPYCCEECKHPIECITVVEHMTFNLGNAVKYIWRADHKGKQIEDLHKAVFYINREIVRLEGRKMPRE